MLMALTSKDNVKELGRVVCLHFDLILFEKLDTVLQECFLTNTEEENTPIYRELP